MDLLEKTKHPSRLMGSQHHLNSTISFRFSSYLRVCDMVACFEGMGVFGVGTSAAAMVLLDEDVASLPWFDSFSQEALADYSISTSYFPEGKQFSFSIMTDSVGSSYVPSSVNNLLKQWLILLAILPSKTMKNNLLKFILKHEEESISVSKIILKIVSSYCLNCRFSFSFSLLNQPTNQATIVPSQLLLLNSHCNIYTLCIHIVTLAYLVSC